MKSYPELSYDFVPKPWVYFSYNFPSQSGYSLAGGGGGYGWVITPDHSIDLSLFFETLTLNTLFSNMQSMVRVLLDFAFVQHSYEI